MENRTEKNFRIYCYYTVTNSTWGYDALRLLTREDLGVEAGVRLPSVNGPLCPRPSYVYLFESVKAYDEFKEKLIERTLSWHVNLSAPHELPVEHEICWIESARV